MPNEAVDDNFDGMGTRMRGGCKLYDKHSDSETCYVV